MSYEVTTARTPVNRLLVSTTDRTNDKRKIAAVEYDNHSDYYLSENVSLLDHRYVRLGFLIEFKTDTFNFCKIVITNRFTMDSKTVVFEYNQQSGDSTDVNIEGCTYSCASFGWTDNANTIHGITFQKYTFAEVVLSMKEFMFGDVYVQFYESESEHDKYMQPVITQFTLAPTVFRAPVFKWHPTNNNERLDYDNVFNDTYGSYWDYSTVVTGVEGTPDTGRTNVLVNGAANSEYYNDYLNNNRLISNGLRDWESQPMSLSGHPVYIAMYYSFVPQEISTMYAAPNSTIGFEPVNANGQEGANSCYLTTSGNYATSADEDDIFNIRLVQVHNDDEYVLKVAQDNNTNVNVTGHYQRFEAFIGCVIDEANITDNNGTRYRDRKDDAWFRKHTMLHADFALSGIDPNWMSDDKV